MSRLIQAIPIMAGLLIAMACGGGGGNTPPTPPTSTISAVSISPSPVAVNINQQQQFTATVTGTGSYSTAVAWSANGGTLGSTSGSMVTWTAPLTAGSYWVMATSNQDSSKNATAIVTVTAGTPVSITSFTAAPTTITAGQSATLTPVFINATSASIDNGVGTVTSGGGYTVMPAATTTYTLTANGTGGPVTRPVTVTVGSTTGATYTLPGSVTLELVPIPAGTFIMGSPPQEVGRWNDEGPQHQVTITHAFHMAKFPITQAQWVAVMGGNPSWFSHSGGGHLVTDELTRPVESVSWDDISTISTGFLAKLNALTASTRPTGLVFRMPTEAEWEYGARAGTTTRFYWGDDPNYTAIDNYAWYYWISSYTTHPVGQKLPNAYGLYDMVGNVTEWCQDWYDYYTTAAQVDPAGPAGQVGGLRHVCRGHSWGGSASWSDLGRYLYRSAYRNMYGPNEGYTGTVGFRVVLAPPRTP